MNPYKAAIMGEQNALDNHERAEGAERAEWIRLARAYSEYARDYLLRAAPREKDAALRWTAEYCVARRSAS